MLLLKTLYQKEEENMESRETDFQPQEPRPMQVAVLAGKGSSVTTPPIPAKKSNRNVSILSGVLIGWASSCAGISCVGLLCVGVFGLIFGGMVVKDYKESPKVESVMNGFMSAMDDKNTSKAYTFFSTRSKRTTPLADIEKLLEGNNNALFEGFRSATITSFYVTTASNADPDMPQGQVAELEGTISYAGGFTRDFTAVLELEEGEWRIFEIYVTVPPNKFNP
jgi:hypothetical protein